MLKGKAAVVTGSTGGIGLKTVRDLTERYCTHVSPYTTSALMRFKLGEALAERGLSVQIYDATRSARIGPSAGARA